MSEACKTNDHNLALNNEQPEHTAPLPATDKHRKKRHSTSSNDTVAGFERPSCRRRSGITKASTKQTDAGSSRPTPRTPAGAKNMSSVNYTKTGRVSKAKKGLKVHDCECGRSYTRAEHLRRHQRNHAQEGAMICKYPDCDKTFFRADLLQRHEERHNELGNESRRSSVSSTEHSTHASPSTAPDTLPVAVANALLPTVAYQQQHGMSPQPEVAPFPRYNPSVFRTPQQPRTAKIAPFEYSNHVFPSTQSFKSPTNGLKHLDAVYQARHSISGPALVDATAHSAVWHDPLARSPYSCSSGYASPVPGPEYGHIYATPPYGPAAVRTRASSNASFIEQKWAHASQSPTSSVSMPFSWPQDEKSIMASSFPFMPVSYPTSDMPMHASIDAMSQYTQYDPRVVQMDHEEGLQLFQEQYGMSQTTRAYPFEQSLNNYWRLLHPTFPIVHRFTFASRDVSPMLYAAMIAIGLHYSDDAAQKREARQLHKRCVALLSQKPRRLRKTMRQPGHLFGGSLLAILCTAMFKSIVAAIQANLANIRVLHPSAILGLEGLHPSPEDNSKDRWAQWARLSARQHLLLSCFVLESQQYTLLGRLRESSLVISSNNLPFPVHESMWEAPTVSEWASAANSQSAVPITVREALQQQSGNRYDVFQSAVLIAAHHGQADGSLSGLNAPFEQLLSQTSTTQLQLLTSKLARLLPIRALLAVSGESWVLGTKVTSQEECSELESALRLWTSQTWSPNVDTGLNPTIEALRLSVATLKLYLESDRSLTLGLGNELGPFLAALVLWAAIAAATNRMGSTFSSQLSQPTLMPNRSMAATSTSQIHCHTTNGFIGSESLHDADVQQSAFSNQQSSVPYIQALSGTSRFLSTAVNDILALNLDSCHAGGTSLLLWVKMYLHGASPHVPDSTAGFTGPPHGQLIEDAINQIDMMLRRGWEVWPI
ncbi:hypothetical protein OPT61_g2158 [Boeremia exigua]|uniref:Uncharacterized protein n=1 Tax=Boeremia exigua TaxID=749465 RepID=A0ACC2IML3_9PLEO|nr:hypothetical protein OPT61_g2158 [Boeremia exigua]